MTSTLIQHDKYKTREKINEHITDFKYFWIPNKQRGVNKRGRGGGGLKHKVKPKKQGDQNKRSGGGAGNFDKRKRNGLFVNEIQFYH